MKRATWKLLSATGTILAVFALLTAAVLTDQDEVLVRMAPNRFDIVVAGNASDAAWLPSDANWAQGDTVPLTISLNMAALPPGGHQDLRIAVKNASARTAGRLELTISDPNPMGGSVDFKTGNYLELFDQLLFTVTPVGGTPGMQLKAGELGTASWPCRLLPGQYQIFDVRIQVPATLGNRYQEADTDIMFHFEAVGE
ncbi:MAG: hypothetical protein LBR21_09750 [Propionibacteriaceae bacterium]|jgi:hypothetical protein|nr:hypothetical protein [Propionibacteriaceae bacterium]